MTDTSKARLCSACKKNRPAGTFRWFRMSVGGYHIEVEVCDHCKEGLVHAILSYGVRAAESQDAGMDAGLMAVGRVVALEGLLREKIGPLKNTCRTDGEDRWCEDPNRTGVRTWEYELCGKCWTCRARALVG